MNGSIGQLGLPNVPTHPGSHLVAILPDLHIPYQDKRALDCVMKALMYLRPYKTVILGDWLDCDSFSKHPKKSLREMKAARYKRDEIDPCNELLDEIQRWTIETKFVEGNHEFRVERFAVEFGSSLGPDIYDLMSPQTLLSAGRQNFEWIPYGDNLPHLEITPNLWAIHGWYHNRHSAAKHLDAAKTVSLVHGHTHRQQLAATRNIVTGDVHKAWSPGCLSQLQPTYMHQNPTEWVHGFSLVYVGADPLDWTEYIITIENGRCILPDGKEIVA